jgi:tRNA 2-thiocytidine biosynthesis protein TtcA
MHHPAPLYTKIKHAVGRAVADFGMIQDGDRILVAVSGGKDSYTLLQMLAALRDRAPISYELVAATVDSGYPGFRSNLITDHLARLGITHHLEETNHYDIIRTSRRPGSSFCSFCARLKRGVLYTTARRLGCNKLALGHHSDDFIETLLLNQFFIGSLKAMSARMLADDGLTTVIRPLVYVAEKDIISHTTACGWQVTSCDCPLSGPTDQQRQRMKRLIADLERENPFIRRSLLAALANVQPRHLLDRKLWQEPEQDVGGGRPGAPGDALQRAGSQEEKASRSKPTDQEQTVP